MPQTKASMGVEMMKIPKKESIAIIEEWTPKIIEYSLKSYYYF